MTEMQCSANKYFTVFPQIIYWLLQFIVYGHEFTNSRLEWKNRNPIYDQTGLKTIPSFGAAHTYIAHIREYLPGCFP